MADHIISNVLVQHRADTAVKWSSTNPVLHKGEIGVETDTQKIKTGDGSTDWNNLKYIGIPDVSSAVVVHQSTSTSQITAGTELTVSNYVVGKKDLTVDVGGVLVAENGTYSEIGTSGTVSNKIKILDDVPVGCAVTVNIIQH